MDEYFEYSGLVVEDFANEVGGDAEGENENKGS
jgi:hypothetical protein